MIRPQIRRPRTSLVACTAAACAAALAIAGVARAQPAPDVGGSAALPDSTQPPTSAPAAPADPSTLGRLSPPPIVNVRAAQPGASQPAASQPAAAAPAARHHARVSLVPESKTIVAGKPFTVALVFAMDPKWHVYWKDPGDSGMPPSVTWDLPAGYAAGELQYPTPEVLTGPAGTNYVYHDQVALLVEITPDAAAAAGDAVTLVANVKWLECDADTCLPAKGQATASVAVSGTAEPNDPGRFTAWRDAVKAGATFDPATAKPPAGR